MRFELAGEDGEEDELMNVSNILRALWVRQDTDHYLGHDYNSRGRGERGRVSKNN